MAIKVLVTAIGQQIIADVKQVENKESKEVVGYWLTQPRLVTYQTDDEGNVGVNFNNYCLVSNESEFSIRAEHIVTILEPREEVTERYNAIVTPETAEGEVPEETAEAVAEEAVVEEKEEVAA
jgi:hypothetical protein